MRVGELVGAVGQVGEARLLLMAALLVADELSDVYAELATYRNQAAQAGAGNGAIDAEAAAAVLEGLAALIEAISTRLDVTELLGRGVAARRVRSRSPGGYNFRSEERVGGKEGLSVCET